MKKLNIAKVLLIVVVGAEISLFIIANEPGLKLGVILMSAPITLLLYSIGKYGLSIPKENLEETKDSASTKQEIARMIHEKISVDNVKSDFKLLETNDPFQTNLSPDPTLRNR